jgi:hypothetical protein
MNDERVHDLLTRLDDGLLDATDADDLAQTLHADPAARQALVMVQLIATEGARRFAAERRPDRADSPERWRRRAAWAAVALFSAGTAFAAIAQWTSRGRSNRATVAAGGDLRNGAPIEEAKSPTNPTQTTWSAPVEPPTPPASREVALLRRMPVTVLYALTGKTADEEGMVGDNKSRFTCAAEQRKALPALTVGVALADPALVEKSWRPIESTFAHQTSAGNFSDSPYCVAYFLFEVSSGLLLLQESELGGKFADRTSVLLPGIEKAANWLARPEQIAVLMKDKGSPSRMVTYAGAFSLSGKLLGNDDFMTPGNRFLGTALALQRPDGSFSVLKGHDSGYQGTVLWRLARYALRFPDSALDDGLRRAGAWEMGRISASGEVDVAGNTVQISASEGTKNSLNFDHVVWGLLYYGALFDEDAIDVAAQVHARRKLAPAAPSK